MASGHSEPRGPERVPIEDAVYLCDVCGEEIVIPVDPAEGDEQEFTEDCPVCCHPHTIRVVVRPDGELDCWATSE